MKVLIAGLGAIGQRHARNLRTLLPDAELLTARSRGRAELVDTQLGISSGDPVAALGLRDCGTIEAALDAGPDVVFVCTPSSLHLPLALAAAQRGCHLFIEKPLAHSWDRVPELLEAVERRRLVAAVGCQWRFHPCLIRLRALLESGGLGRVLAARLLAGEWLPGWHPYEDYRESYAARAELGGGVVLTQIHELDYAHWIFGPARRVFAAGGHLSRLELDVEDVASVILSCEREGRVLPVQLQLDYLQRPPRRSCEVLGEEGRVEVDLRTPSLEWTGTDGECRERLAPAGFERNLLFLAELRDFLDAVDAGREAAVSLREGARVLQLALAVKRSLATGQAVEVA